MCHTTSSLTSFLLPFASRSHHSSRGGDAGLTAAVWKLAPLVQYSQGDRPAQPSHHPPPHPGDTLHPLIKSPLISLFASPTIQFSHCYLYTVSLCFSPAPNKNKLRVDTLEEKWAKMNRSPVLDAYFPTEYLNDHSVICWLFKPICFWSRKQGECLQFQQQGLIW